MIRCRLILTSAILMFLFLYFLSSLLPPPFSPLPISSLFMCVSMFCFMFMRWGKELYDNHAQLPGCNISFSLFFLCLSISAFCMCVCVCLLLVPKSTRHQNKFMVAVPGCHHPNNSAQSLHSFSPNSLSSFSLSLPSANSFSFDQYFQPSSHHFYILQSIC